MSILDTLTQLRSHLERCMMLLDTLSIQELPSELKEHVDEMRSLTIMTITGNVKSVIKYKQHIKIPFVSTPPIAAETIKDCVKNSGDLELIYEAKKDEDIKNIVPIVTNRTMTKYHIDPELNKIVKAYCEMGGVSLHKLIKPFKLDSPKLEMIDLLQFINDIKILREQKGLYSDCAVYAHLCNYSTIYVGIARTEFRGKVFPDLRSAVESRLHEHRNWPSNAVKANWTALNKVITCMLYFPGDKEDEDLLTQLFAHCIGENNVRGGNITWIGPYTFPSSTVTDLKSKILDRS